jgi:WD40 repeat protein
LAWHPLLVNCLYGRFLPLKNPSTNIELPGEGRFAIFTEFVTGNTLDDEIRSGRLYQGTSDAVLARILDIAIKSAWALAYIHRSGVVHQGIRPANLLLSPDGLVKLNDFVTFWGLGASAQSDPSNDFCFDPYFSPEQVKSLPLTSTVDCWSWGLLVLEMFQGKRTWSAGAAAAQVLKGRVLNPPLPDEPGEFSPGSSGRNTDQKPSEKPSLQMPGELVWLLRRCFRKNPSDRPTAEEISSELEKIYRLSTGVDYPCKHTCTYNFVSWAEERNPTYYLASLNNKALCSLDLGLFPRALQLWDKALEINPAHLESVYNQGLFLWRTARIDDVTLISKLEALRDFYDSQQVDDLLRLVNLERGVDSKRGRGSEEMRIRGDEDPRGKIYPPLPCPPASPLPRSPVGERSLSRAKPKGRTAAPWSVSAAEPPLRCPPADGGSPGSPFNEGEGLMGLIRQIPNHTNLISSVCFTGDGRFFLSTSDRHTFKLWSVATGECLRTFVGHTQEVKCVCVSADGKYALSASWDRTMRLWDVISGNLLRIFPHNPHQEGEQEIFTITLSADGVYALSSSGDRFSLWHLSTGECLRSFVGHKEDVLALALSLALSGNASSHAPSYALSGSLDKTIKLWEVDTGICRQTLHGHQREVTSITFSNDGDYALSGSRDRTLKLWQLSTGDCLQTMFGHGDEVTSVCLTPDGKYALSASSDHTLKLWHLENGRCLRTFEGDNGAITSLCLSPDGQIALSGSMDHTLKLWYIRPPRDAIAPSRGGFQTRPYCGCRDDTPVVAPTGAGLKPAPTAGEISFSSSPHPLGLSAPHPLNPSVPKQSKKYRIFRLPKKSFVAAAEEITLTEHSNTIGTAVLSADGRIALFAGSLDKFFVAMFSVDERCCSGESTGEALSRAVGGDREFVGHKDQVRSLSLSSDNSTVLSGSADKTVKLWELATGKCLCTLTGHQDAVNSVSFSADGLYVISGSSDRTIKLWHIATGKCLYTLKGHYGAVNCIYPSPDGRYLLSGSADTTLKVWDLRQQKCLRTFKGHQGSITSLQISADGAIALTGSTDKTLRLWHLHQSKCLQTLIGHTAEVTSVCLTQDGRYALSASQDQTVKIWQVANRQCLHTFMRIPSSGGDVSLSVSPLSVSLSADGSYALCSSAMTLKLWSLDWELENRDPAPWDEAARPYLEVFLTLHTPGTHIPGTHIPGTEVEEHSGENSPGEVPTWTEADFQQLLRTLSWSGYGWLEPEGCQTQLEAMAANWQWLSPFIAEISYSELEDEGTQLTYYAPESLAEEEPAVGPPSAGGMRGRGAEEPAVGRGDEEKNISPAPLLPRSWAPPDSSAPQGAITLVIESGPLKGQKFHFNSRITCVIGRGQGCSPLLPNDSSHQTVSRYHCLLDVNPPFSIRIRDLNSKNGTIVNSQILGKDIKDPVAKNIKYEMALNDGDHFKLGYTSFAVLVNSKLSKSYHIDNYPGLDSSIKGNLVFNLPNDSANNSSGLPILPTIEGYTILDFLGQGRTSQVHSIRHNETGQIMALKVLRPQSGKPSGNQEEKIAPFLRDLENLKNLRHPNIIQLIEYGYWGGQFFLIMEHCPGENVVKLMQQQGKCLSVEKSLEIIFQVLDALDYAHNLDVPFGEQANVLSDGKGLFHGTLKPANIFLSGGVKLSDYALDKAFDLAGLGGLTMTGIKPRQPIFICRQQAVDFRCVQAELDVWTAAACLYFMLTGRFVRNFVGENPWLTVLQTEPVPIGDRHPGIPKVLAELVDLALGDRGHIYFKKAAAFKQALESVYP